MSRTSEPASNMSVEHPPIGWPPQSYTKDSIIQAIVSGTDHDLEVLKPIYAAYISAELDKGGTAWALRQAIGQRLVEHAKDEITEDEECKYAGGKRLLEHTDSPDELTTNKRRRDILGGSQPSPRYCPQRGGGVGG